ncbi:MAG: hypothetical protein GXO88_03790 [Chlorobi bacterium]|nr:hypothetical protein [Chlorobiota bacterium]
MNYSKLTLLLVVGLIINSCSILNQAGEYDRFVNSVFTLKSVKALELGGVGLSGINDKSSFNAGDIMTLTGRLFSGSMPAKLMAEIEVRNNTDKIAAISGMEWKLLLKDQIYATGQVDDRVEVKPNSSKTFKLRADVDLLKVLSSESLPQIIKVVTNINDARELKKLGVELRIKPYYKSGANIKKYPGYISLKP